MANVANVGHRTLTLCNAADLLSELNAFDASTSRTASLLSASNISRMAWIAASLPHLSPAQT